MPAAAPGLAAPKRRRQRQHAPRRLHARRTRRESTWEATSSAVPSHEAGPPTLPRRAREPSSPSAERAGSMVSERRRSEGRTALASLRTAEPELRASGWRGSRRPSGSGRRQQVGRTDPRRNIEHQTAQSARRPSVLSVAAQRAGASPTTRARVARSTRQLLDSARPPRGRAQAARRGPASSRCPIHDPGHKACGRFLPGRRRPSPRCPAARSGAPRPSHMLGRTPPRRGVPARRSLRSAGGCAHALRLAHADRRPPRCLKTSSDASKHDAESPVDLPWPRWHRSGPPNPGHRAF